MVNGSAGNGTVGIVIPTMDRFEFLGAQLAYYAEVGCAHTIYVGDSSGERDLERTRALIADLSDRLKVVHLHLPGSNDHEAIYEALRQVEEPYSAIAGDDDFLVPAALAKCAEFMETHPDFSTAHGVGTILSTSNVDSNKIIGHGPYELKSAEHETAGERLTAFMANYYETVFSVHRTDEFRRQIESTLEISWTGLRDLLACALSVVYGKSKKFDIFYLVRRAHPAQNPDRMAHIDWITSPEWAKHYQVFQDQLSGEIIRRDNVSPDEARSTVKQAFYTYTTNELLSNLKAQRRINGTGSLNRLRMAGRQNSIIRKVWHFANNNRPQSHNPLSVEAMLRRSSPYHDDFMPIYRAISSPMAESMTPVN